jgi:peptidylprolyl isomerase
MAKEEHKEHTGNIYFYIILSLIILVLISVIFKNYKPVSAPVLNLNQEQTINNEESLEVNKNIIMEEKNIENNTNSSETSEKVVKNGDTVFVHYTGTLENGTKFDSSLDRGQPFDFVVGAGRVIKGWDQGLLGMKVGEKKRLVLPPDLAYGPAGVTMPDGTVVIPQNATLIFDIELISIN